LVGFSLQYQRGEARFGEARAGIVGELVDDLAIATVEQHIGYRRVNFLAPRYREQVVLTLGPGDLDQIDIGKTRRLPEDGLGDRDLVVQRQPPNDQDRSVVDKREPRAQLRTRAPLDPLDQEPKHTLEQQDLIFTVSLSAGEKEIGHASHRLGAALGGAAVGRALELDDK